MWPGGPDKVVYLSPDSPNVLSELEEGTLYVIGGIIDQTVRPGMSLREANKASGSGVRHARLPVEAATGRSEEVATARREAGNKLGPSNLGSRFSSGSGSGSGDGHATPGPSTAPSQPLLDSDAARRVYSEPELGRQTVSQSISPPPDASPTPDEASSIGAGPGASVRPAPGAHRRVVLNIDHVVLALAEYRVRHAPQCNAMH